MKIIATNLFNTVQQLLVDRFGGLVLRVGYQQTPQGDIPMWEIVKSEDFDSRFNQLSTDLKPYNLIPIARNPQKYNQNKTAPTFFLLIAPVKPPTPNSYLWPVILFLLTLGSVLVAGIYHALDTANALTEVLDAKQSALLSGQSFDSWFTLSTYPDTISVVISGTLYAIGLIMIVGTHEMGHKLASRYHDIPASLPYFIPMPLNGLGTFGAIISQKSPIKTRNALFDIGISGPIAGLLVAIIATCIGLLLSVPVPKSLVSSDTLKNSDLGSTFLIFEFFKMIFFANVPSDATIFIHPLAFAGWIGLLITGLNLVPLGQLDGGHVFRSFLNEQQHRIATYVAVGLLIVTDYFFMAILMLFFYMQYGHPGAANDVTPLSFKRRVAIIFILLLTVLTFPIPEAWLSLL